MDPAGGPDDWFENHYRNLRLYQLDMYRGVLCNRLRNMLTEATEASAIM